MPTLNDPMQIRAGDLPVLRAAYSDRTAFLMARLANLAYSFPPPVAGPGPATIPFELSALGFERVTYFHNGMVDGWAFAVEGPDIVALAFRGTASIRNWETDFHVAMLNPPGADPQLRVHEGFYHAFARLDDGATGLQVAIAAIEQRNPDVPIYFTGHSLGGALAQIATAVLGSDQIAACYTFGSPRVGNSYFDLWVKPPSYRVENYADIVPQIPVFAPALPPVFYRHSGDARYLPETVEGSPFRYEPNVFVRFGRSSRASSNSRAPERSWALKTTIATNISASSASSHRRARNHDDGAASRLRKMKIMPCAGPFASRRICVASVRSTSKNARAARST